MSETQTPSQDDKVVALYAAVRNLQGHQFTYPLIGQRVRAYLAK